MGYLFQAPRCLRKREMRNAPQTSCADHPSFDDQTTRELSRHLKNSELENFHLRPRCQGCSEPIGRNRHDVLSVLNSPFGVEEGSMFQWVFSEFLKLSSTGRFQDVCCPSWTMLFFLYLSMFSLLFRSPRSTLGTVYPGSPCSWSFFCHSSATLRTVAPIQRKFD